MLNENKVLGVKKIRALKRVLRKWNYEKHNYEPYMVPIYWKCKTYCNDMNEISNCAQCGKEINFGDSYTSQEIQTGLGFGYCVCSDCHEIEMKRKR